LDFKKMNVDVWLLVGLTAVGASWIVVHIVLLMRVVNLKRFYLSIRLLALIPIATPVVVWLGGHRLLAILWILHALVYLTLWLSG
jgi:hypothetical protein